MAVVAALVAVILLIPRLHDLDASVTPDEPRWVARSANFGFAIETGHLADTFQAPHPGVPVMWLGVISQWLRGVRFDEVMDADLGSGSIAVLERTPDQLPIDILNEMRQAMILANVALYVVLFALFARLIGMWPGAVAVLFLGLDPMQIGFTRLLHMDGLSTTCMLVSVVAWSVWLIQRSRGALLGSAIVGGLGIATRSVDLALIFFLAAIVFVDVLMAKRGAVPTMVRAIRQQVVPMIAWTVIALTAFVASWPALWVAPLGTLRQLRSGSEGYALNPHEGNVVFRGEVIRADPGALFYPIMLVIRTTPLTAFGLVVAIVALLLPVHEVYKRLICHLAAFAVLYTVAITLSEKKLDRYALPTMGALNLIAVLGSLAVGHLLLVREGARRRRLSIVGMAIGAAMLLLQIGISVQAEPYYGTYVSPFLGDRADVVRRYSLYNAEGGQAIARALAADPTFEDGGTAGTNWPRSTDFYLPWKLRGSDRSDTSAGMTSFFTQRYLVLTEPEIVRELYPERVLDWLATLTPVLTIDDQGDPIAWVYDMSAVHVPATVLDPTWPAFGWENGLEMVAADVPATGAAGSKVRVQMLLQAETEVDAMVTLSLVDADGTIVASGEKPVTVGTGAARMPMTITLPAGMSNGPYRVVIAVADVAGGEVLAATDLQTGDAVEAPLVIGTIQIGGEDDAAPTESGEAPED